MKSINKETDLKGQRNNREKNNGLRADIEKKSDVGGELCLDIHRIPLQGAVFNSLITLSLFNYFFLISDYRFSRIFDVIILLFILSVFSFFILNTIHYYMYFFICFLFVHF